MASPAAGRAEGHFSPVQSWTPSPEPAGRSPGGQVSEGATRAPSPPPRWPGTSGRSAAAPQAAPGPVTCLPTLGYPPTPFCFNHCNTCPTNRTPAFLRHLPLLFFPFPSLQPWPWSSQLQRKHTHTHAQNQLWNVFLPLRGVCGSRGFSEHLTSTCISTPRGLYSSGDGGWELGAGRQERRGGEVGRESRPPGRPTWGRCLLPCPELHAEQDLVFPFGEGTGLLRARLKCAGAWPPWTFIHSLNKVIHSASVCRTPSVCQVRAWHRSTSVCLGARQGDGPPRGRCYRANGRQRRRNYVLAAGGGVGGGTGSESVLETRATGPGVLLDPRTLPQGR